LAKAGSIISAEPTRTPSWRFVLSRPTHFIALLGGIGLIRFAPGTFGTLAAFPIHHALSAALPPYAHVAAIALLFVIGVWASGRTAHDLGMRDHGGIVCDETVAFLLVLLLVPGERWWQAAGFLLFRLFDIFKPPPIRHFERALHGGFGVMFDDLLAAGYTLLLLAGAKLLIE
jgi:phosphatidylglycerophosphatase A